MLVRSAPLICHFHSATPMVSQMLQTQNLAQLYSTTYILLQQDSILLIKREDKMAGYCKSSLSSFLASVDKHAKRESNQYPAILTERAWSIKDLLYGIPRIHVTFFFLLLSSSVFVTKSSTFFSLFSFSLTLSTFWRFSKFWRPSKFWRFSTFRVLSREGSQRKASYCHEIYFAKENVRPPAWTMAKFYCGNKTGNPAWAVSLHLVRSGS